MIDLEKMTKEDVEIKLKKLFKQVGVLMAYNEMSDAEVEIPVNDNMTITLDIKAIVKGE